MTFTLNKKLITIQFDDIEAGTQVIKAIKSQLDIKQIRDNQIIYLSQQLRPMQVSANSQSTRYLTNWTQNINYKQEFQTLVKEQRNVPQQQRTTQQITIHSQNELHRVVQKALVTQFQKDPLQLIKAAKYYDVKLSEETQQLQKSIDKIATLLLKEYQGMDIVAAIEKYGDQLDQSTKAQLLSEITKDAQQRQIQSKIQSQQSARQQQTQQHQTQQLIQEGKQYNILQCKQHMQIMISLAESIKLPKISLLIHNAKPEIFDKEYQNRKFFDKFNYGTQLVNKISLGSTPSVKKNQLVDLIFDQAVQIYNDKVNQSRKQDKQPLRSDLYYKYKELHQRAFIEQQLYKWQYRWQDNEDQILLIWVKLLKNNKDNNDYERYIRKQNIQFLQQRVELQCESIYKKLQKIVEQNDQQQKKKQNQEEQQSKKQTSQKNNKRQEQAQQQHQQQQQQPQDDIKESELSKLTIQIKQPQLQDLIATFDRNINQFTTQQLITGLLMIIGLGNTFNFNLNKTLTLFEKDIIQIINMNQMEDKPSVLFVIIGKIAQKTLEKLQQYKKSMEQRNIKTSKEAQYELYMKNNQQKQKLIQFIQFRENYKQLVKNLRSIEEDKRQQSIDATYTYILSKDDIDYIFDNVDQKIKDEIKQIVCI